jgi:predicted N-acetyltransferase YhbS
MSFSIRKMRAEDLGAAIALLARWNLAPTPDRPDAERAGLDVANSFVAVAGDFVIGVASYILAGGDRAETASLAVDPAWRGRGVGAALQAARLAELKARGVRHVRTEADRPETIDWYVRKFGYRIAGKARKKHPFSLHDVEEWTVLELDLA